MHRMTGTSRRAGVVTIGMIAFSLATVFVLFAVVLVVFAKPSHPNDIQPGSVVSTATVRHALVVDGKSPRFSIETPKGTRVEYSRLSSPWYRFNRKVEHRYMLFLPDGKGYGQVSDFETELSESESILGNNDGDSLVNCDGREVVKYLFKNGSVSKSDMQGNKLECLPGRYDLETANRVSRLIKLRLRLELGAGPQGGLAEVE